MWGGGREEHGDKSEGCGRNASVYHVYPVSHTTGEGRAECSKGEGGEGGVPTASGRIYVYLVGTYYTRSARSRQWCGWRGRRGQEGESYLTLIVWIYELELRHGWLKRQ